MGFLEVLTLLFIGLKLTDHIDWSWWEVTAPIWIGYPVGIFVATIIFLFSSAISNRS